MTDTETRIRAQLDRAIVCGDAVQIRILKQALGIPPWVDALQTRR